jgi:polysaccharide pyruvyl transferase WcaK-like protein
VIHHVFANRSNVGDWVSALGIQSALQGHAITEHLCDEPFIDRTIADLGAADPGDLIVIGGGGLLMDYFTPFWEAFLPFARERRFVLWGIGVCDLKDEDSNGPADLHAEIAAHAALCVVRDEPSRQHIGLPSLPDPVPCPSHLALAPRPVTTRGLLHSATLTTVGGTAYRVMRRFGRQVAAETRRYYAETNNRIEPGDAEAFEHVLEAYAAADVILSSRLHGCVLGLAAGRPVVAVSGDHKVDAYMETVGLGDWVCQNDDLRALPAMLRAASDQPWPGKALAEIVAANRAVGTTLRAMADAPQLTRAT